MKHLGSAAKRPPILSPRYVLGLQLDKCRAADFADFADAALGSGGYTLYHPLRRNYPCNR